MQVYSAAQIRAWDQFTIQHEPIAPIDLMERAAEACLRWLEEHHLLQKPFVVFAGPGNNGGDGLALARKLFSYSPQFAVFLIKTKELSPDCQLNLERLQSIKCPVKIIVAEDQFPPIPQDAIVIDALFGIGLNKPLSGLDKTAVEKINASGNKVISIDLPSGLFADETSAGNTVVKASHSLTFQTYKLGLLLAENGAYTGKVHVLDIGLHKDFDDAGKFRMITEKQVRSIYKQRNPFTHKGHFGHAALVTGSQGLMGAATLAAAACMRSGVGKLTCYVPAIGYQIMQLAVPEAMARISGEEYVVNYDPVFKHESIGTGPGIGFQVKPELLEQIFGCGVPLLLDADILTLLSKHPALLSKIPPGSVMTPHPKEFDRMFGSQVSEFGRINLAIDKANELNIVIVLKGHHTLIALPNAQPCFNTTGNAGMATGGSGDVLAGLITGLLAQGYTSKKAAILGVWLHGRAGDLAAKEISEEAMIAGDIVQYLGKAFQSLSW